MNSLVERVYFLVVSLVIKIKVRVCNFGCRGVIKNINEVIGVGIFKDGDC